MKKIVMLILCLYLLLGTSLADVCTICSGDRVCDACSGDGYTLMQVYNTNMKVKITCTAGCRDGVCPVCPAVCDVCGSDGLCNTCEGNGYVFMQAYGSDRQVKIACTGSNCDNGRCTACQSGAAAAVVSAPTATPKPTPKPTKKPTPKPTAVPQSRISFKDPVIEAAVKKALHGTPTTESLKSITTLEIDGDDKIIYSLDDLLLLPNLHTFELKFAKLRDYSAVTRMPKLKRLKMVYCDLTSLETLRGMTQLTELLVYHNQISDVSPLKNLTNLESLWVGNNQISDISPLKNLTKLYSLDLEGNRISDIRVLAGLPKLRFLYLKNNRVSDTSPLAGLQAQLDTCELDGNPVTTIIDAVSSSTTSSYSSSSSDLVISSPLAVFPTISKVKLAATKRDGDLTIYQYTYMEYQFLREYLDTLTYEDLTLVAEGRDKSGATHFYYRHNASGGEVEIIVNTYDRPESKFSVYAYDGITLSDYH